MGYVQAAGAAMSALKLKEDKEKESKKKKAAAHAAAEASKKKQAAVQVEETAEDKRRKINRASIVSDGNFTQPTVGRSSLLGA